MAYASSLPQTGTGFAARIHSFVEGMKHAYAQRAEYNRTYAELQRLSDRELCDIGIRRCDIADIVSKHCESI